MANEKDMGTTFRTAHAKIVHLCSRVHAMGCGRPSGGRQRVSQPLETYLLLAWLVPGQLE